MALRRIPAADLFKTTVRQPLVDLPQKGHCYISFRAGFLSKKDGKLSADKRKGQVAIVRTDSGGILLQWFERVFHGDGAEQFSLLEEAEFEHLLPELGVTFEWFKKDKRVLKAVFKNVRVRLTARHIAYLQLELSAALVHLLASAYHARTHRAQYLWHHPDACSNCWPHCAKLCAAQRGRSPRPWVRPPWPAHKHSSVLKRHILAHICQ